MKAGSSDYRRGLLLWGSCALAASLLEYPFVRVATGLIGPVLQPYPTPSLTYSTRGDVFANLSLPAAGIAYVAIWLGIFALVGIALAPEVRSAIWFGSWLIAIGVLVHFVLHYGSPWLLVMTDKAGISTAASASPPRYLNVFQPPIERFFELPVLVAGVFLWTCLRWRKKVAVAGHQSKGVALPIT